MGGSEAVSACQKGHLTVTMEKVCVCVLSYCSSSERETICDPGCERRGSGRQCVEVFNPTVTTIGIGVPYHL